ncbi:MAG TPA: oxidoreductase [Oceanospirillaceae bacterium]|nr:oxidoreductase [Oceanospirillaceae bacterium]
MNNAQPASNTTSLGAPLTLPCGAVLKNRLVKSPMSDSLGNGQGDPSPEQARLYEKWSQGGVALAIIGEVQIDPDFAEKPGNLVLGPHSNLPALTDLTSRATTDGAHLWAQLGHAGALSYAPISQPKGPSALDLPDLQCAGMSAQDIAALPAAYARGAAIAKQVGFSGVLLHAGHGFLLSQFLSPLFNHRRDGYGGSIENRMRIVVEIFTAIRQQVGPAFPIGIRINATDLLEGGLTEEDALCAIRILNHTSVDLIDISGGTYFPGAKAASDGSAEGGPYFLDFARRARQITQIPLMTTGGFKHQSQAQEAVGNGDVDMVGLARVMVVDPQLPKTWLQAANSTVATNPSLPRFTATPEGGVTAWYTMQMVALGEDTSKQSSLDLYEALATYSNRDEQKCALWRAKFAPIDEFSGAI